MGTEKSKTDKLDIAILLNQQNYGEIYAVSLLRFLTLYFCSMSSNIDQGLLVDGSAMDCHVECFEGVFGWPWLKYNLPNINIGSQN